MAWMGLVMTITPKPNRYTAIILKIFQDRYEPGAGSVPFRREDIQEAAEALSIELPKNLLIAKPLGTQFIDDQTVAIFEFERSEGMVLVASDTTAS